MSGLEQISQEVRTQIGKGADVIKVYADYRAGRDGEAVPLFSVEEMAVMAKIAISSHRQLVASMQQRPKAFGVLSMQGYRRLNMGWR